MNEKKMFKKRIREIEAPLEERKTFQSGYSRKQRDKVKCFSCGKFGILQEIVSAKEVRTVSQLNQKKKRFLKMSFWEKKPRIR